MHSIILLCLTSDDFSRQKEALVPLRVNNVNTTKFCTFMFVIFSLAYSHSNLHLLTVDSHGTVRAWGRTEKSSYKPRILSGIH